jgi:hypothetical protein
MKRLLLLAAGVPTLTTLLFAASPDEARQRNTVKELAATVQSQLESHGERVLGQNTYRWSTRLAKMEDCRAEFTVRISSNYSSNSDRTEKVSFSLGALDPYDIDVRKSWLELPCFNHEKCIFSVSTCSQMSKDGIVTDCASASPKQEASFALQLDGDPEAAARLGHALRDAIGLCRQPKAVVF